MPGNKFNPKGFKSAKSAKEGHHVRSNYVDHSRQFVNWINRFEFEKTTFGRVALRFEERFKIRRLCILFLFCITLSYLLFYDFDFTNSLRIGEVALTDVKSPVSFEVVDVVATEEKKVAAEKSTPPVFDFDNSVYDKMANRIFRAFRTMRERVDGKVWSRSSKKRIPELKSFASKNKAEFEELLGHNVSNAHFDWLAESLFSTKIENLVVIGLERWSAGYLAESLSSVITNSYDKIVLRTVEGGEALSERIVPRTQIKDISRKKSFNITGSPEFEKMNRRDQRALVAFAETLLKPNITLNRTETDLRDKKARQAVLPVVISVKKNQTIVSKGAVIQPIHLTLIREIQKLKSSRRTDFVSFLSAILLVTLVLVFFSFLKKYSGRRVQTETRDLWVMAIVGVIVVGFTKLFWFMTNAAFSSRLGWFLPESFFLYAAPVTLGAMLVGLLITRTELVWIFTVFIATALGLMVENKFSFFMVAVISGVAAARGVNGCKKRNDIYLAGLRTGAISALMIGLVFSVDPTGLEQTPGALWWLIFAGFVSGIFSSGLAMMIVPLLESAFNYTTNVKLLELSNLNHPLLKDMIVRAPGTYHHSLVVGSMVEGAAEEIGCNPLLAKVMAYYHDIGKTEHAAYFIENQKPGYNPHDKLSPHMSKTILVAHVKDGAEMGMRYKLGKPIIDGILQHHGTTLISYFYNKALDEQDEDIDLVKEDEFRYPGPKPQFKEAALCMLADSIEAAARSLDEPTTARLQNIVRNIIQRKFMEGQLEECDLTLRDLSVIEASFERILLGIYHHRVDYPRAMGGGAAETAKLSFVKSSSQKGSSAG